MQIHCVAVVLVTTADLAGDLADRVVYLSGSVWTDPGVGDGQHGDRGSDGPGQRRVPSSGEEGEGYGGRGSAGRGGRGGSGGRDHFSA